jgi:hypothetical protein
MSSLNLKHLHYFWGVAANGSIARASEMLHLTLFAVMEDQLLLLKAFSNELDDVPHPLLA